MSESDVITHCLQCGSADIAKTLNSICDDAFHCRECKQEFFESVAYSYADMDAFKKLESELKKRDELLMEILHCLKVVNNKSEEYFIDKVEAILENK